jgi:hypothetical protein
MTSLSQQALFLFHSQRAMMSCFVFSGHPAPPTDRSELTMVVLTTYFCACLHVHAQLQQRYSMAASGSMEMTNGNGIASMQPKRSDNYNNLL